MTGIDVRGMRRAACPGFTYAEVLTITAVLGVLALVGLTSVNLRPNEAEAAARTFASNVAYAQAQAIARPDLGCLIKVNSSTKSYWIALTASPDTPVTNPITKLPYLVQFGSGAANRLTDVTIGSYSFGGDAVLGFDAFGALDQSQDATITFQAGGETYTVTIAATTGVAVVSRSPTGVTSGGGGGSVSEF